MTEPEKVMDLGEHVYCDYCSKDYSDSSEVGGLLFGSYGAGPCCAQRIENSAKQYGETWNIKGRCPSDKSFRDWVLQDVRQGDNTVKFYNLGAKK